VSEHERYIATTAWDGAFRAAELSLAGGGPDAQLRKPIADPLQRLEPASRSAIRAKDSSSPRKPALYDPNAKNLAMTAGMIPFVQNSWVKRVPWPWASNVACWTPRRSQLRSGF
jgi:hypothetical protein